MRFCFCFAQTDMREFRIGKKAIRNFTARRHAVAACQVGMDNTKIVNTNVRELRATCHLTDRPNTGRSRLESIVDPAVTPVRQLDASEL